MTPAEWVEHVEENLGFTESGLGENPERILYATQEQCDALKAAHLEYCQKVEKILFPDGR